MCKCNCCPQNVILVFVGIAQIIASILAISAMSANDLLTSEGDAVVDVGLLLEDFGLDATLETEIDNAYANCDATLDFEEFFIKMSIGYKLLNGDDETLESTKSRTNYDDTYEDQCECDDCNKNSGSCKGLNTFREYLALYISFCIGAAIALMVGGVWNIGLAVGRRYCCKKGANDDGDPDTKERPCLRCCISCCSDFGNLVVAIGGTVLFLVAVIIIYVSRRLDLDEMLTELVQDVYPEVVSVKWDTLQIGETVELLAAACAVCGVLAIYLFLSWFCTIFCACCRCCCWCCCGGSDEDKEDKEDESLDLAGIETDGTAGGPTDMAAGTGGGGTAQGDGVMLQTHQGMNEQPAHTMGQPMMGQPMMGQPMTGQPMPGHVVMVPVQAQPQDGGEGMVLSTSAQGPEGAPGTG